MSQDNYDFLYEEPEKNFSERMVERFKSQPFLVIGWLGTFSGLAYGAYRYKTRGASIKLSVFLVQLRVFAQGAIVASLSLGMIHQMYLNIVEKKNKEHKD